MVGNFAAKNFSKAWDEDYDIPFDMKFLVNRPAKDDSGGASDTVTIPCHKLVLAISSPVFANMFFSAKTTVPELSYDGDAEVTRKNTDPDILTMIVKFCYNRKLELSSKPLDFLVQLYTTAARLEITDLEV